MSSGTPGLASALHRAAREADQISLFGFDASPAEVDALRDEHGRLPLDAFRRLRSRPAEQRGPGRPLGSPNKRSEQLAKLVIHQFGDPVLGAASLYAMPLDQLCEALLVADGTAERQDRMEELTGALAAQVNELGQAIKLAAQRGDVGNLTEAATKLADAAESLEQLGKTSGKAGQLALAALNTQLAARRFVGEYVHSKKPVAVEVDARVDGVLVMAGGNPGAAPMLQQVVDAALHSGAIEADQIARLEFRNGQLHDPEGEFAAFDDVPADDDEAGA